MTITGRQIRQARAPLKLDHSHLARRVKVITKATLIRAEAVDGEPSITIAQASAIQQTLEQAGVEFTADPPGVLLRSPSSASPDEA